MRNIYWQNSGNWFGHSTTQLFKAAVSEIKKTHDNEPPVGAEEEEEMTC